MTTREQGPGLRYWLLVLRGRWLAAACAGSLVTGLVGGFLLARPETYSATTVLSLGPGADGVDRNNDRLVSLLVSRYAAVGQSTQTLSDAAVALGLPQDALSSSVEVVNPPETVNLRITAALPESARAAEAANEVASAVERSVRADGQLDVQRIQTAVPPLQPGGLGRVPRYVVALLLGLLAAAAVVVLAEGQHPRLVLRAQLPQVAGGRPVLTLPHLGRTRLRLAQDTGSIRHAHRLSRQVLRLLPSGAAPYAQAAEGAPRPASRAAQGRLVLVVAPAVGAGASTVAALLAGGLARSGARVLLATADGRVWPSLVPSAADEPAPRAVTAAEGSASRGAALAGQSASPSAGAVVRTGQVGLELLAFDRAAQWGATGAGGGNTAAWALATYDFVVTDAGAAPPDGLLQDPLVEVDLAVVALAAGVPVDEARTAVEEAAQSPAHALLVVGNRLG